MKSMLGAQSIVLRRVQGILAATALALSMPVLGQMPQDMHGMHGSHPTQKEHTPRAIHGVTESHGSHNAKNTHAMPDMQHAPETPDKSGMSDMPSMRGSPSRHDMHTTQTNAPAATETVITPRSPDYSDGYASSMHAGMLDDVAFGALTIDRLEYAGMHHGDAALAFNVEGWYGKDFNRIWIQSEGHSTGSTLEDMRTEVLWHHAISPFWNSRLGARHDSGIGPDRNWAAFGLQGLLPYNVEIEAMLYLGDSSHSAARFEFSYESPVTQRLILEPRLEINVYGQDDPARRIGAGLSKSEIGLRLRYKFKRGWAPYVGLTWQQRYGGTADFARRAGEQTHDLNLIIGIRVFVLQAL